MSRSRRRCTGMTRSVSWLRRSTRCLGSFAAPSTGAVLRRTNHTLYQSRTMDDAFTTMFCVILSLPSRRLDYASAGHPPAILFRPATGEMAALDTGGRPLGLDPENPIEDGTV